MNAPGFFTRGIRYELPHPPIDLRVILLVNATIAKAFDILRASPPAGFDLRNASEDEITRQLHSVIENRLRRTHEVAGFDSRAFGRVTRAPEVTNYDRKHPAKKPDLFFDLKRESLPVLSDQDGIFVECKPVDENHSIVSDYCRAGMSRFAIGDYAWAMKQAMMVAYVRDGHSIPRSLISVTPSIQRELQTTRWLVSVSNGRAAGQSDDLHVSEHKRNFSWFNGQRACKIQIYHSWHPCN